MPWSARLARAALPIAGACLVAAGLLLAIPGSPLAGGITGNDAPSRIPVPARAFTATFVDTGGTQVQASKVTFDGEVFVYGKLGQGQVTVPFEKIATVETQKAADPLKRTLKVTLKEGGDPVSIIVEDDTAWWGRTSYGNYKIEVRDLARVQAFAPVAAE